MASYTVIADVGNAIVELLREHMVPEVILNPEAIGLCNPEDKGDFLLGVYLYDVRPSEMYRNSSRVAYGISQQKYPSTYWTLNYMITAYSNGDVKLKATEEQKILGRAMQVLADYSRLDPETLKPVEAKTGTVIQLEFLSMSADDKMKIWSVPNKAYRLSFYLTAGPVELGSAKTMEVKRVVDVDFAVQE